LSTAVEQPLRGLIAGAVVVVPQRGEPRVDATVRLPGKQIRQLVGRVSPLALLAPPVIAMGISAPLTSALPVGSRRHRVGGPTGCEFL
jgi:hypothetical protein